MTPSLTSSTTQTSTDRRTIQQPCPNCGHSELQVFYEVPNIPVHSCLALPDREMALSVARGSLSLGFCPHCGFITNTAFDERHCDYLANYEDQQGFSPTFNSFTGRLSTRLIEKYNLQGKRITEIGCSKGDFLLTMCQLNQGTGIGIDPSATIGRALDALKALEAASPEGITPNSVTHRVSFIHDFFSEAHQDAIGEFVCCRHTLEHIGETQTFLQTLRRAIGDRLETVVFFEIPDMGRVLRSQAFEDIYYEHCSYFTTGSLAYLFRQCGFEILDLYLEYGDQYLMIEAKPAAGFDESSEAASRQQPLAIEDTVSEIEQDIAVFTQKIETKLATWRQHLQEMKQAEKRVAIWASGSKCTAFLTTLDVAGAIACVVDINPYRQGTFVPGVGLEVQSPQFLQDYQPDEVILMNAIYRDEIQKMLTEMNVNTKIVTI
ncbi:MAG: class I SAM-dependent methyltransferase [Synechococcales bacterium]|nr:class I SAM-dependent methyltransferase [Synechococcales bacterium]